MEYVLAPPPVIRSAQTSAMFRGHQLLDPAGDADDHGRANQITMPALAMVVISGMVGAPGHGAEVYAAMTTLKLDPGFESGLGVVVLAIYLDRITSSQGDRSAVDKPASSRAPPDTNAVQKGLMSAHSQVDSRAGHGHRLSDRSRSATSTGTRTSR
ncbi:hypothetical protein [Amycolatopsis sp. DSM 110486]|uniref:hypothetical protein n=1 Tax=Amycolatopsis sp. DSM 110486 TaxID=2865832 RepID=UPI0021053CF7|nr:hypothetical protein [Amycolatopsis sp. DSM 110486]